VWWRLLNAGDSTPTAVAAPWRRRPTLRTLVRPIFDTDSAWRKASTTVPATLPRSTDAYATDIALLHRHAASTVAAARAMRIATWNCARGPLAAKRAALAALAPDIVVLTEASQPSAEQGDVLWFGEGRFGVAFYARPPFKLRAFRTSRCVPCVYPVAVTGPIQFTLFGVWTWPAPTYKKAFINGFDAHERLTGPAVVAGDFNGNVDFDRPRGRVTWAQCFDRLHARGLVSAYHADRPYGKEPDATHYFQWKVDRPFHLDYCFVPRQWSIDAVSIGSYADWSRLSDHRPVTVDVRLP
jgi:endonuclease/exonuclease/phosphatase family metal-dependent hydrolase